MTDDTTVAEHRCKSVQDAQEGILMEHDIESETESETESDSVIPSSIDAWMPSWRRDEYVLGRTFDLAEYQGIIKSHLDWEMYQPRSATSLRLVITRLRSWINHSLFLVISW